MRTAEPWSAGKNPFNPKLTKESHAYELYREVYTHFKEAFARNPGEAQTLGKFLKEAHDTHNDKPLQEALSYIMDEEVAETKRGRIPLTRGARKMPTASVKVHRPTHVPKELHPVWHGAAVRLASAGRLLNKQGQVDYPAVNRVYQRILAAYQNLATEAEDGTVTEVPVRTASAPTKEQRIATPANWPFQDITPNDISRMAAQGRWDLVSRAASMAIRVAKPQQQQRRTA